MHFINFIAKNLVDNSEHHEYSTVWVLPALGAIAVVDYRLWVFIYWSRQIFLELSPVTYAGILRFSLTGKKTPVAYGIHSMWKRIVVTLYRNRAQQKYAFVQFLNAVLSYLFFISVISIPPFSRAWIKEQGEAN